MLRIDLYYSFALDEKQKRKKEEEEEEGYAVNNHRSSSLCIQELAENVLYYLF